MKSQQKTLLIFGVIFCFISTNANAIFFENKQNDKSITSKFQNNNKQAQFPGGKEKLNDWLRENMDYPEDVKRFGTVVVNFMVKKNGKLTDFKIQKGVEEFLDVAAIEILRGMPKWVPATKNGKAVDSMVQLPVKFVPKSE